MNKCFFQISEFVPPDFVTDIIKSNNNNWSYTHIKAHKMNDFIINNVSDEFPNFLDVFESIKTKSNKIRILKYYILYIKGGVYLGSDLKLIKNIDAIFINCDFFSVNSAAFKNEVFGGFMGSMPKNNILKIALTKICENIDLINENKYDLDKELYSIIIENKDLTIKMFNELINEYFSNIIDDNNSVIAINYYKNQMYFIESNNIIKEKDIKTKKKSEIKIGISFNCPESIPAMYSNGINQNTLFFCETLLNIGYDAYLIVDNSIDQSAVKTFLYDSRFKVISLSDIFTFDFDFCVSFGFSLAFISKSIRYLKTKLIAYFCGNSYIIQSEQVLYNEHKNDFINYSREFVFDKIWSIPQMVNTNKHYWKTLYRCECVEVPFIWSNKIFENSYDDFENFKYKKRDKKNIAIFEPNISIMKWCLPAILVCENAYRISKNIDHLYITNAVVTNKIIDFNMNKLTDIIKNLDIFKDNKVSIERRYNTLVFMSKHADIAVSHQWENPLNYLYFDLAWMGWPIVHNAHLCKDIGYYYENFDYEQGGKILNEVILNHDNNYEEYMKKNRELISRYLPSNEKLQNEYINLFENV